MLVPEYPITLLRATLTSDVTMDKSDDHRDPTLSCTYV